MASESPAIDERGPPESLDLVVVGAGAGGLMAACQAARTAPEQRVVVLEGAKRIGAKILVSGGGRCNLTNRRVVARDFRGSGRKAIDRVLRRFRVEDTVGFFAEQGLEVHEEERGKLYPDSEKALDVVRALVAAAEQAGAEIRTAHRVERIEPEGGAFRLLGSWEGPELMARRVILATGGRSLPRSGSDGWGFTEAARLGHGLTPHQLQALVPLRLEAGCPLLARAGTTLPVRLTLVSATGAHLEQIEGSLLITHVGISGPAALDMSRHFLLARETDPGVGLSISWLPHRGEEELQRSLQDLPTRSLVRELSRDLPRKLVETLVSLADLPPPSAEVLPRTARRRLVEVLLRQPLPVTGPTGWQAAEVTAGGVPLGELDLKTMESRRVPGLHLAGEVLDVDGRLGGFNFQWAWASGFVAGSSAARLLGEEG